MLNLLYQQSHKISELHLNLSAPLLLSGISAVTILFILNAYGWVLILRILDYHPSTFRAIRIWMVSSIVRYIPGGVWSYISRAEQIHHEKVNLATFSVSLWLETIFVASSSLAVGFPALLQASGLKLSPWYMVGMFFLLSLGVHPKILSLLSFIPGRIGLAFSKVKLPNVMHIFAIYCYYCLFWFLFGAVFVYVVNMITPLDYRSWLPVGSSLALGFFAGFIVLFIPSGIGVREATLYYLLIPHMSENQAMVIAISSRLWIMTGEVLSLLLIEILFRIKKAKQPD